MKKRHIPKPQIRRGRNFNALIPWGDEIIRYKCSDVKEDLGPTFWGSNATRAGEVLGCCRPIDDISYLKLIRIYLKGLTLHCLIKSNRIQLLIHSVKDLRVSKATIFETYLEVPYFKLSIVRIWAWPDQPLYTGETGSRMHIGRCRMS
jgi:hypothetical protein